MGEIKPGTYKARALRGMAMRTDTGTTYIGLEMRIFDGETTVGELPASLWTTKPETTARAKRSLELLGWRGEIDGEGWMIGFPNVVPVGVVDDEYKGRITTKVDWVGESPFSGGGLNDKHKLQPSDARRAAAEFARSMGLSPVAVGGKPSTNGNQAQRRPARENPDYSNDANEDADLPF